MAFQSVVNTQMAFGIVGEPTFDGPRVVQPGLLNSGSAANNVFGRAFSVSAGATGSWAQTPGAADPKPVVVAAGGANPFYGLLVNPKEHPNYNGDLSASFVLPNGELASFAKEGQWNVALGAASNPGDLVSYLTATGVLVTSAPGAALPANSAGPIGTVERFVNAGASIASVLLIPFVGAHA